MVSEEQTLKHEPERSKPVALQARVAQAEGAGGATVPTLSQTLRTSLFQIVPRQTPSPETDVASLGIGPYFIREFGQSDSQTTL